MEFPTGLGPAADDDVSVAADPATFAETVRAAIAANRTRRARRVRLTDPDLPAWTFTYRVPDDQVAITRAQRRVDAAKGNDKDPALRDMQAKVLALHNEGVEYRGHPVTADDGDPLTFRDPRFWALAGASNAVDAVLAVYGATVLVGTHFLRLMEESGLGDTGRVLVEDDGPDPTTR